MRFMASWTARALNLHVREPAEAVGEARTLVFLHGFGGDQHVWDPYMAACAKGHRVITYDLACAGAADPAYYDVLRHRDFAGYVDDLLSLLDETGVHHCRLAGHSAGGMIGLLAAAKRPGLIEKVVMIGSSPCYLDIDGYHGGFDPDAIDRIFMAIAADYRAWAQSYAAGVVAQPTEHPATQNFISGMLAMRPDIALATAQMILLGDYRADIDAIDVPAVILQTNHDPAVPKTAARYLHEHLRGSVMEIIDAAGHMPHMTATELIGDALARHLLYQPADRAAGLIEA
jgi:sigma-B regulation protein RsbQ